MLLKGEDGQRLTDRGTNRGRTEDETVRFGEGMLNKGSSDVWVVIQCRGGDHFAE